MTVGENIRRIRKDRGLTLKELGDMVGVSEAYIRAYESGRRNPKQQSLEAIATALHVNVEVLTGANFDGNNFTDQAINNGATVIVTEKDIKIPGICIITVENSREALATMSANFFDHPARKLKTIAITGTKGKTSTSFMIK